MFLPRAVLAPHLPTLLLDEHRRHDTPMLEALRLEARRLAGQKPEILVVVSARANVTGPFQVGAARAHRSLTVDPAFGVEVRYDCPGHPALARALVEAGVKARLRVGATPRGIDGGVSVPLHFLLPARVVPVVPVALGDRPEAECRAFGAVMRRVLGARPERIGILVGGMLSHATHEWHFRREVPEATVLDQHVLAALGDGRWDDLLECDPRVIERAHPDAGLRHLALLRGILGADVRGEVLSYEAGPGVGSALVAFEVPGGVEIPVEEPPLPQVAELPVLKRTPRPRRSNPRESNGRPPRARVKGAGARPRRSPPQAAGRAGRSGAATRSRSVATSRPASRGPSRPARRVSAGSRTPTARRPARASRPGRKRAG